MVWNKVLHKITPKQLNFCGKRYMVSLYKRGKCNNVPYINKSIFVKKYNEHKRTYLHFARTLPEDYELPLDTFPENIHEILMKDKKSLDFIQSYWYWKIRSESNLLNYEKLIKKSYKQLAIDMGMQIANSDNEHMLALLEYYEYLKSSPFVGPFGTIENPVLVPRGTGENEHVPLFFRCREGFLYRCGECDQIFMHVRVLYSLDDGNDPFPKRSRCLMMWPTGNVTYRQMFLEGKWGNQKPNT
ncbi:cytochrome c oxidase subunit [Plasmodium falciparum RAJ116]|uniref:Cytochrome c oxidase subunit n=1 Tax=Plasmodium falciparum RAJ116 TaxID=580058 RepID=A0A0L0CZT2_PLAFA|nr:cytochrome c oxidase subunit [Plasmodium falciparum RAJ116]